LTQILISKKFEKEIVFESSVLAWSRIRNWIRIRIKSTLIWLGTLPEDVVPFDAASSVPIEDQKETAMINIQKYLNSQQADRALALLRAARYRYLAIETKNYEKEACWSPNDTGARILTRKFQCIDSISVDDLGQGVGGRRLYRVICDSKQALQPPQTID
jgi:hypothetical protein